MTTTKEKSQQIVRRVPKDDKNQYGIVDATNIPIDEPCIVAIGGERTITRKDANYYASILNQLFGAYGIDDIAIYSAYYSFENTNRNAERHKLFLAAQTRLVKRNDFKITPENEYIRDLYQHIIFPRIVNDKNERFSDSAAIQNMRRVMIFTHCHGAAVVRIFQSLMMDDLQKYGYDKRVIPQIMKNLLVVQHAPTAPIHNSLFNTVSFMSASDTRMEFHNEFSRYVADHAEDMVPAYFDLGNFFATYTMTKDMVNEHQIVGLVPGLGQNELSSDGALIMAAERNALVNGARNVANCGVPLDVSELISPASESDEIKPDFNELKANGDNFVALMKHDLRNEMTAIKGR